MRALFLAALAFALVGVGAWLVFSPAPGESAPRALAESASSGSNDAADELRAEASTARAESLSASADDRENADPTRKADSVTCAELFRPGDLWVRWLDREGRPTTAPRVVLVARKQPNARAAADAAPLAPTHTHAHEQLWSLAAVGSAATALREQRLELSVESIFPRAARVAFTYEAQRTSPLELRLPPHGELVVVIHDGGMRLPEETRSQLRISSPGADDEFLLELEGRLGEALVVPMVGLDAELELEALAFRKQLRERRVVRAPAVDGQSVREVLSFGSSAPVLLGQVRDDVGASLAETKLQVLLRCGDEEQISNLLTTPEGRLLWSPELSGDTPRRATLELATNAGLRASVAELEIPATGIVDLGVLEFHARAAGLAGRVVDRDGAPVAKAEVEIEVLSIAGGAPPTPIPTLLKGPLRNAVLEAEAKLPPEAQNAPSADVNAVLAQHGPLKSKLRTDEHGRFAWEDPRGKDPGNQFLVAAKKSFLASEPRAVPGGSSTIELRLEKMGELGGRVLLAPGSSPSISLRLRYLVPGTPAAIDRERTRLNAQGKFRWMNLAAGRYELEIAFESRVASESPLPLLTLRDLVVPAGGRCVDTRLDPIDLRQHFATFAFELRNRPTDRVPSKDAFWFRRSDREEGPWIGLDAPSAKALSWTLPRGAYDFVFDLDRCRRIELRGCTEGAVIELQPIYRVRVTVENLLVRQEKLGPPWTAGCESEKPPARHLPLRKISDGVFEVEPPTDGPLRFFAALTSTTDKPIEVPGRGSARITIADATELQEFRVQLR